MSMSVAVDLGGMALRAVAVAVAAVVVGDVLVEVRGRLVSADDAASENGAACKGLAVPTKLTVLDFEAAAQDRVRARQVEQEVVEVSLLSGTINFCLRVGNSAAGRILERVLTLVLVLLLEGSELLAHLIAGRRRFFVESAELSDGELELLCCVVCTTILVPTRGSELQRCRLAWGLSELKSRDLVSVRETCGIAGAKDGVGSSATSVLDPGR